MSGGETLGRRLAQPPDVGAVLMAVAMVSMDAVCEQVKDPVDDECIEHDEKHDCRCECHGESLPGCAERTLNPRLESLKAGGDGRRKMT
jgi:hypothetical protein